MAASCIFSTSIGISCEVHGRSASPRNLGIAAAPRNSQLSWRLGNFSPGEVTGVEVRFDASGEGTRVSLEHRGFAALPPGHPCATARRRRCSWRGWAAGGASS